MAKKGDKEGSLCAERFKPFWTRTFWKILHASIFTEAMIKYYCFESFMSTVSIHLSIALIISFLLEIRS